VYLEKACILPTGSVAKDVGLSSSDKSLSVNV
jgi:hypothetical protein